MRTLIRHLIALLLFTFVCKLALESQEPGGSEAHSHGGFSIEQPGTTYAAVRHEQSEQSRNQ